MEEHGELLKNLVGKDEKFALGKAYDEALTVQNSGSIDTFVRVILTKSWTDADGNCKPIICKPADRKQTLETVWNTSQTRKKECLQYRTAKEIHTYRNDRRRYSKKIRCEYFNCRELDPEV
mgnify:CR=1 FL=1